MLLISIGVAVLAVLCVIVVERRRRFVRALRTTLKRGDTAAVLAALARADRAAYELVPQIAPHAASADVAIRRAAIRVLVKAPGEAAERVVRAHVDDPDGEVRAIASSRILGA